MQVWSTWAFSFWMGLGVLQLLIGYRLEQEVPLAEIALSYKKILYRKVNSLISALAVNVTIRAQSVPRRIGCGAVGQAKPVTIAAEQAT